MGRENVLILGSMTLKTDAGPLDGTIEERFVKLATAVKSLWCTTDEDERLKIVIAVLIESFEGDPESQERIYAQVRRLDTFTRMLNSKKVDDSFIKDMERETAAPWPLVPLWGQYYRGRKPDGTT